MYNLLLWHFEILRCMSLLANIDEIKTSKNKIKQIGWTILRIQEIASGYRALPVKQQINQELGGGITYSFSTFCIKPSTLYHFLKDENHYILQNRIMHLLNERFLYQRLPSKAYQHVYSEVCNEKEVKQSKQSNRNPPSLWFVPNKTIHSAKEEIEIDPSNTGT